MPADLLILQSDNVDPIIRGNLLTYTLTVTNSGPDPATNVVLTDTLSAEVTLVSTSIPATVGPGGVVTVG